MSACTAAALHAHADAIEHAAALGGFMVAERQARRVLTPAERAQWAHDAAVIREAAYRAAKDQEAP